MAINIQVINRNSLGIPRGLYLDWMGNALSDSNANTLLSEGTAIASNIANPDPDGGVPVPFTTRSLTKTDDGATFVPSDTSQSFTLNSGMTPGFGCSFNNNIGYTAGAGVTITDKRTSGATNPVCAILNVGTNAYDLIGSKA